eukprot:TRINITY_DN11939_c0_g1_i1.p1 TRINITY_DN11939_c0_g1~~TRINITY_DN11939_c0_g1_i1.p1  ORF type:complete len:243 (-),score=62.64 TRINITY_DN11939_c0_g1_i1:388-1116(-)
MFRFGGFTHRIRGALIRPAPAEFRRLRRTARLLHNVAKQSAIQGRIESSSGAFDPVVENDIVRALQFFDTQPEVLRRNAQFTFEDDEHSWRATVNLRHVAAEQMQLRLKDTELRLTVVPPNGFSVWLGNGFTRSVWVPAGLVVDDIDAVLSDDGVLRITFPKQGRPMPAWPYVEPGDGWASTDGPDDVPIIDLSTEAGRLQQSVKHLNALGYKDAAMCTAILQHYQGDLRKALASLVGLRCY